jgi:hypothetical protein
MRFRRNPSPHPQSLRLSRDHSRISNYAFKPHPQSLRTTRSFQSLHVILHVCVLSNLEAFRLPWFDASS